MRSYSLPSNGLSAIRRRSVPFIKHSNLVPRIPQESQLPSIVVDEPSLDLGRDRRPRMSLLCVIFSRFATFLYVCYPKIIRSKPPVYKFMLGTFTRVKSSGNTRRKCHHARRIIATITKNNPSSKNI